jgi:hypothetical protein
MEEALTSGLLCLPTLDTDIFFSIITNIFKISSVFPFSELLIPTNSVTLLQEIKLLHMNTQLDVEFASPLIYITGLPLRGKTVIITGALCVLTAILCNRTKAVFFALSESRRDDLSHHRQRSRSISAGQPDGHEVHRRGLVRP